MNLWLAPQISEHCPNITAGELQRRVREFRRPGTASAFTPSLGTVQEWSTSQEVTNSRVNLFTSKTNRVSVSNRRKEPSLNFLTI